MNCPRCGKQIGGLACPACTALKSHEAIFDRQGSHLRDVRTGRLPFYAKRLSMQHPWHLMLFGDKAHGFCGIEIQATGRNNRLEIPYRMLAEWAKGGRICVKCLAALAQIEEREAIREES